MNQEMSVSLSAQEWDVVGNALGQRPFVEVANLFTKIQSQVQSQQKAAAEPAKPPEKIDGPV